MTDWIKDGHKLRVTLDSYGVNLKIECPPGRECYQPPPACPECEGGGGRCEACGGTGSDNKSGERNCHFAEWMDAEGAAEGIAPEEDLHMQGLHDGDEIEYRWTEEGAPLWRPCERVRV